MSELSLEDDVNMSPCHQTFTRHLLTKEMPWRTSECFIKVSPCHLTSHDGWLYWCCSVRFRMTLDRVTSWIPGISGPCRLQREDCGWMSLLSVIWPLGALCVSGDICGHPLMLCERVWLRFDLIRSSVLIWRLGSDGDGCPEVIVFQWEVSG